MLARVMTSRPCRQQLQSGNAAHAANDHTLLEAPWAADLPTAVFERDVACGAATSLPE
jgi:hypothetical protein